ncbi:MAG TPA: hypothetical protein VMS12_07080 [Thermoanaerobaculia bacterium]|nr:hypothetical protein [Thermoanaerobaculia bacterium]
MENDSIPDQEESPAPVTPPPAENPAAPAFQKPADYYSSPPESNPGKSLPKWVPLGCGGAGCLFLVLMVGGAAFIGNQGASRVLSWMFERMEAETMQMVAADVPAEQRQQLEQEFKTLTSNIEQERVGLMSVQPILEQLRVAVGDQNLTREEVEALIESLRKANASTRPAQSP